MSDSIRADPQALGKNTRLLRNAFGCFATGVAIVTAPRIEGGWIAITINSFSSVSLDPPLLLFSLSASSNCLSHLDASTTFGVSILKHDQQVISNRFARPSTSHWDGMPMVQRAAGYMLVDGALATFSCRRHSRHLAGDHVIYISSIESFESGRNTRPLAFFKGTYGSFTADQGELATESREMLDGSELSIGWG